MAKVEVKANKREAFGKGACRQMRLKGQLPATMYSGGTEAVSLTVESRAMVKVLNSKQGDRAILELDIEGSKQLAMIRDMQVKTMSTDLLHIDFIRISMDHKVQVSVPVELLNLDEVKKAGGVTQQNLTEVNVECFPDRIPDFIEVDMGGKEIGESFLISDLSMPEGIELQHEPEEVIASILAPRVLDEDELSEGEGEEAAQGEGGKKDDKD
jgi:large subunit ribosomal protein L25